MTPTHLKRTRESGLTLTKLTILQHCAESPVTSIDLSKHLDCTQSNLTGIVDGMERSGLVTREANPDDRRSKLVTITAKGKRVLAGIFEPEQKTP
jgi:DNA-binding MarR family transcriptional regulator